MHLAYLIVQKKLLRAPLVWQSFAMWAWVSWLPTSFWVVSPVPCSRQCLSSNECLAQNPVQIMMQCRRVSVRKNLILNQVLMIKGHLLLWITVQRIRGKIIRTVLCCMVNYSSAQWYAHIWAVYKGDCWRCGHYIFVLWFLLSFFIFFLA